MSIQFGGLATGLDTQAIIQALLSIERRPIDLLQSQKETEQSKLSLIGTLEGLVKDLQAKATELTESSFFAYDIEAAQDGVATFTTTGTAPQGVHTLEVTQLASANRFVFGKPDDPSPITDPDQELGGGQPGDTREIRFSYDGTNYSILVPQEETSFNGIAAAINEFAGEDVTASVINAGTEASPEYRLVVAGNDTGADFALENFSHSIEGLPQATEIEAQNAQVVLDGITIERSTNVFSDVLAGVSFTVQKETDQETTFTVNVSTERTTENVQSFVDAYNGVIDFIAQQNSYSEDSGAGGPLFGDSALDTVRSAISGALFNVDLGTVQADTEGFSTLGLIGVNLGADGRLSIDQAKFDAKLGENQEAVEALFSDSENGLLVLLDQAIDGIVESSTNPINDEQLAGVFERRRDRVNDAIRRFDANIERLEFNLGKTEESLIARFANLESLVNGLNAQGSFLTSGLISSNG